MDFIVNDVGLDLENEAVNKAADISMEDIRPSEIVERAAHFPTRWEDVNEEADCLYFS